jgi:4-diphosphocytidyl-2-C-methyl-D-erythritol kinase
LTRNTKPITIADFLAGRGGNDCEALVCQRYPEVAHALHWLGKFAQARMTGTGACVFAAFEHEDRAQVVARQFITEHSPSWQAFAAKGMNRSPLHRFTIKM